MIQHIFFDLDNTLWDLRKNAYLALKEIFKREQIERLYNIDFEEFHREYHIVNERLWAKIRDGEIDKEYLRKHRFYDTFLSLGIDNLDLAQRFEYSFLDEILLYNELVEGASEIMKYLTTKGYTLHIISNGFAEVTDRKCEVSGIKNLFKTITCADEIGIRKPNPEIYDYAFAKTDATKENSIMIGDDWVADAEGAVAYGIPAIFFDVYQENFQMEKVTNIRKLIEIKEIL